MSDTATFRGVIDLHGGADKLAQAIGIPVARVWKWTERDTIPAEYWLDIAARRKVTLTQLATMYRAKKRPAG